MATPGRVMRSTRASSTIDARSTVSSPDPLNNSFDSVAVPSSRVTRSVARARSSTAKSVPARSSSPRKQTFALDVGSTKKPSRLYVTVEAEGSELLEGENTGDFKDAKRLLFPTPTPKRKRDDTTTTSIPLRDEDTPGARTPGRRGRPRRQQTPRKATPAARKRVKLSPEPAGPAESPEKPKSTRKKRASGTSAVKATPGRKRKAAFVPEETITWASPSPPNKRLRESPSFDDDEAPAGNSPASSDFQNEPTEDTVAQEDFSPIFAHSLVSMRASHREQEPEETQEIGEATSLIIENALEELRQSRGEAAQPTEMGVDQPEQVEQPEEVEQPVEDDQPVEDEQLEDVEQPEHDDQPEDVEQHEVDEQPEDDEQPENDEQPEHGDQSEQVAQAEQVDQLEEVAQPEQVDQPDHVDHFDEDDDDYHFVEHSADEADQPEQVTQPDESAGETSEADEEDEVSARRTYGLNYADFSSSVATKRRSSPRAAASPFRNDDASDYEDSFSEIPQEILDAAAPRGNWPGEARLRGSPIPVLAPPRAPSVDQSTRPSLSPIVRAGRALQSVTSDDASPRSHKNHLGSPFKPAVASTPVQTSVAPPLQEAEERPQSAASKKSWISDIIEAGINWFSPSRASSHASPDSLSVGQDAANASPSLPLTRPAPTEDSVFKPQSRRPTRQATVEDEEEDIWEIEALRDEINARAPTPQQESLERSTAESAGDTSRPYQFTSGSRKYPVGPKLGSEKKRTFANRSNAFNRLQARKPWKPSSIAMSSDSPAELPSEASEYSLIASGKQAASAKRSATQQSNEGSAKRRKDMMDFFSSPSLLPGAENAARALERKRLELAPKPAVEPTRQYPYSLPTTSMFPSDRPFFKPPVDSPTPALVPTIREPPKLNQQDVERAERNRAIRQARLAFRATLEQKKKEHEQSGAHGGVPPFEVPLDTIQFPQAFKDPRNTDLETIMSREEVNKWAQETSNIESSSPLTVRHQPNKHASPTKSCLRPSTKPRTPGPRLQWGSDVLSPASKHQKLAEKFAADELKEKFIGDFKNVMYEEYVHEDFGQGRVHMQAARAAQKAQANKENQDGFIALPPTPTRDIDMMDVDFFDQPAESDEDLINFSPAKMASASGQNLVSNLPVAGSPASSTTHESVEAVHTPEEVESPVVAQWSHDDWCYLEDLFHLRKKGPFPFDFPADFEPQSRHLVGLTMTSHGEKLRVNPWHISVIDGFQANTGRKWPDEEIARKVMSLAIVDLLRKEKRDPKKPWRNFKKATYRAQAGSSPASS